MVNDTAQLPDHIIQYCDPERPCTFVPGPRNLRRWEIMILPGEDARTMLDEETVWSLLSRWITPAHGTIWRVAAYRFHALVGFDWRCGRFFLAGDAAHQTPPFMAQGLNQGIRDAANLVWKIAAVLKRGANESLLDSYDQERRPNARAVIEITKSLGQLICETDPVAAAARDSRLLADMKDGRGDIVRQDLLPPLATGCLRHQPDGDHLTAVGRMFPQPSIHTDRALVRMDELIGSDFLMIVPATLIVSRELADRAAEFGVRLATFDEPTDKTVLALNESANLGRAWMTRYGASSVLIRPDHVVFGSTTDDGGELVLLDDLAAALQADIPRR